MGKINPDLLEALKNEPVFQEREEEYIRPDVSDEEAELCVGSMFGTARPTHEQRALMLENREQSKKLGLSMVKRAGGVSPQVDMALRKLQEAVMHANRAVLGLD